MAIKTKILYKTDEYTFEAIILNKKILIEKDLKEINANVKDEKRFFALLEFIKKCLIEKSQITPEKFKSLKNGIYEIKFHSSIKQKEYRFFNFFFQDKRIIITNSYVKKTNKTDKKQIEKAINIKNKFEKEF